MSKSILVIDTPKSCSKCKLCDTSFGHFECLLNKKLKLNMNKDITFSWLHKCHPQCPLQDTSELLESLGNLKCYADESVDEMSEVIDVEEDYNKLYKALGGKDE